MWRLFVLAALIACGEPPKETKTPPPEVTLYGVTMRTYRGSTLAARGEAGEVIYERSSGDAQASAARLHLPAAREGGDAQTVQAPRMKGNLLDRQAIAEGGVELLGSNGLVGHTARAHFDGVHLIADGKDPIRIDGPGYGLTAEGFSFALTTEDFSFNGPVAAAFGGEK